MRSATTALLVSPLLLLVIPESVLPPWLFLLAFALAAAWRVVAMAFSSPSKNKRAAVQAIAHKSPETPPVVLEDAQPTAAQQQSHLWQLLASDHPYDAIDELDRLVQAGEDGKEDPSTIARVEEIRSEIMTLTAALGAGDDIWQKDFVHRGVTIYKSRAHKRDFKVVHTAEDTGLFDLISLVYETDLYYKWVPGCCASTRLRPSTFRQFAYLRFHIPVPMVKDRHLIVKGYGDVYKGRSVMIFVKSVEASPETEAALGVQSGSLPVRLEHAGMLFTPRGTATEIQMMSRIDLGLAIVPDSVFDQVSKYILAELIYFLKEKAKQSNVRSGKHEMWTRRQVDDPVVYDEARRRMSAMVN